MRRNAWFVSLLLLCGCRGSTPLGEVAGTVRLDGVPAGQILVVFIPEDPRQPQSAGVTDDAGSFQLHCNDGCPGAVVGEHRVTLVDAAIAPSGKAKDDDELPEGAAIPASRVPANYSRPDKTPLRQTVNPGTQSVTIEVSLPKKPES